MKALAAQFAIVVAAAAQSASLTPAQRDIAAAEAQIQKEPKSSTGYNDLVKALIRRERETCDPQFEKRAEHAVEDSLRSEPENFEALKGRVLTLLARREDRPALELAQKLHKRIPDDVAVWGMIADASMGLGDYEQAENASQWMLRLRRGNFPGMIRGSLLRIAYGDAEGALDWLTSVFKLTNGAEVEERAWLLTQIARVRLNTGKAELADQLLTQALGMFPEYYLSLDALAETKSAEGKYADAVDLLRRAQKAAPRPQRLFALAVALKQNGDAAHADDTFAAFEHEAGAIAGQADNANRELIFYYADYAHKPPEALRVAKIEIARRHDIATLDAYAWALFSAGQYAEARAQLDRALKVGVRDPALFAHAAQIAAKLEDKTAQAKFEKQERELRP